MYGVPGGSEYPKKPYSHSRDLYGLLRFLKVEKTSLVGLSRGGRISISLILEHPEMVQTLILVSSNLGRLPQAYRERFFQVLTTIHQEGSGADRIVGAIRPGVRPGDAAYAAMT